MTERRPIYLEQAPPLEVKFLAFTDGGDWHTAAKQFVEKFGQEPDAMYKSKGILYVGPIPWQRKLISNGDES